MPANEKGKNHASQPWKRPTPAKSIGPESIGRVMKPD
jgi:hypothetical protein